MYLLGIYFVLGNVPGTGTTVVQKTDPFLSGEVRQ